jgi:hypothetical protein
VNAASDLVGQDRIDRPVAVNPAQAVELGRDDSHAEMSLPAMPGPAGMTRMAGVTVRFVDDGQELRRESGGKLAFHPFADRRLFR